MLSVINHPIPDRVLKGTFADTYADEKLVYLKYYFSCKKTPIFLFRDLPPQPSDCSFLGSFANDPESSVAVTGCLGNEPFQVTIVSRKSLHSDLPQRGPMPVC